MADQVWFADMEMRLSSFVFRHAPTAEDRSLLVSQLLRRAESHPRFLGHLADLVLKAQPDSLDAGIIVVAVTALVRRSDVRFRPSTIPSKCLTPRTTRSLPLPMPCSRLSPICPLDPQLSTTLPVSSSFSRQAPNPVRQFARSCSDTVASQMIEEANQPFLIPPALGFALSLLGNREFRYFSILRRVAERHGTPRAWTTRLPALVQAIRTQSALFRHQNKLNDLRIVVELGYVAFCPISIRVV